MTKHDTVMKRNTIIPAASALALLLGLASLRASAQIQTQLSGNSLNIWRDTANTVMPNSGSAAFGRNNTVPVSLAYAFGERNTIGQYAVGSFVSGGSNTVTFSNAVCLGRFNSVSSSGGLAIGQYLQPAGTFQTFVIGEGLASDAMLGTTNDHCLLVGFQSTRPTLTVTRSYGNSLAGGVTDRTGKVAIGDVWPQAKLHVRSDEGEEAGLILEPKQPSANSAFIQLRDNTHRITVSNTGVMSISAGQGALNVTGGNFSVNGSRLDVGTTDQPRFVMTSQGTPAFYSNAYPSHGTLVRFTRGSSYALVFGTDGLAFRTAVNQEPRGTEITNWRDPFYLGTDGKITLNGKVGVNTDNTLPDYALAVNGGVIATRVRVELEDDWPDHVFDPGRSPMPLGVLEAYIHEHRHLPGMPSASEAERDGIDLGRTQAALLERLEELTLHVIALQRRVVELEGMLSADTARFTYDACGNRIGRALEFSRSLERQDRQGPAGDGGGGWLAEVSEPFGETVASLFPNPTNGGFVLALSGKVPEGATARLLTAAGQVLETVALTATATVFDLSGQPAGVYLLRIDGGGLARTWKVVKRR